MIAQFVISLRVRDPIDYAAQADPRGYVAGVLRGLYERRCYGGYYITGGIEVDQVSDCEMEASFDGSGQINVKFRAEVRRYAPGDVVLVVVSGAGGVKAGASLAGDAAVVILGEGNTPPLLPPGPAPNPRAAAALLAGQVCPVVITGAEHSIESDQVSCVGFVAGYDGGCRVYRVVGELGPADRAALRQVLDVVAHELRARTAIQARNPKMVEFFDHLMHPARDRSRGAERVTTLDGLAWAGPAAVDAGGEPAAPAETRDMLLVLAALADGVPLTARDACWWRPAAFRRGAPMAASAEAPPSGSAGDSAPVAEVPPVVAFTQLAHGCAMALRVVNTLAEAFPTPEDVKKQVNLWTAIRAAP